MTIEHRTVRRIRPVALVRVAAAGALLGTAWDLLHVRTHTTVYSIGFGRMPWWVPLEFAVVYVAGVVGIARLGSPAKGPHSTNRLTAETVWVSAVYAITAFGHRHELVVVGAAVIALLARRRSFSAILRPNIVPAVALVVLGSTTEAILIACGVFRYTYASLGSIPLWLPLLYANAIPFAVALTEASLEGES
jgi:hypothetical protein